MKKKILAISLAVSLVAVAALGVTLAYFTDTKAVDNVITLGNVSIDLEEIVGYENDEPIIEDEGHTYPTVAPGDALTKKPYVTNTGASEAHVFLKLTLSDAAAFSTLLPSAENAITAGVIDFNSTNWTVLDNDVIGNDRVFWIAYNAPLAPAGVTVAPFTTITIPTEWTNADVATLGADGFSLNVTAYAIQTANLTQAEAYAQVNP